MVGELVTLKDVGAVNVGNLVGFLVLLVMAGGGVNVGFDVSVGEIDGLMFVPELLLRLLKVGTGSVAAVIDADADADDISNATCCCCDDVDNEESGVGDKGGAEVDRKKRGCEAKEGFSILVEVVANVVAAFSCAAVGTVRSKR